MPRYSYRTNFSSPLMIKKTLINCPRIEMYIFHVTSNDDVCFDFLTFDPRVWQAKKCGCWVKIGMKGRKYIVIREGIGLKQIIVSKTFIYLLYIT